MARKQNHALRLGAAAIPAVEALGDRFDFITGIARRGDQHL
jgi:hypothetical protein